MKKQNSEPLFETDKEYQEFCNRFSSEVTPELDRQRIARAESERDAMNHLLD